MPYLGSGYIVVSILKQSGLISCVCSPNLFLQEIPAPYLAGHPKLCVQ